jgi:hypothetical protein
VTDSGTALTGQATAAATLRLDFKGASVRKELESAGVSPVLLKGRAFACLLYDEPRDRPYADVDLLVPPADARRAEGILRDLGFRRADPESPSSQTDPALAKHTQAAGSLHGGAWVRDEDTLVVDLHHSLPQVTVPPAALWNVLERHVMKMEVGGRETTVLDPPASALLIALHAAHHGPYGGGAMEDLRRATRVFDTSIWQEARGIADALDVAPAMGAGLGLTPDGAELALRLGLSSEASRTLRMLWDGANWSEIFLAALQDQRSVRDRLLLLRHGLWPTADALRRGSSLARRGPRGLAAAYVVRAFQLLRRLPVAALRVMRARRSQRPS